MVNHWDWSGKRLPHTNCLYLTYCPGCSLILSQQIQLRKAAEKSSRSKWSGVLCKNKSWKGFVMCFSTVTSWSEASQVYRTMKLNLTRKTDEMGSTKTSLFALFLNQRALSCFLRKWFPHTRLGSRSPAKGWVGLKGQRSVPGVPSWRT